MSALPHQQDDVQAEPLLLTALISPATFDRIGPVDGETTQDIINTVKSVYGKILASQSYNSDMFYGSIAALVAIEIELRRKAHGES